MFSETENNYKIGGTKNDQCRIIVNNMAMLIEKGIITEENTINTYVGWKLRGYKVKKGEKHIAEFPIWVKSKKKEETEGEETEETKQKQKKARPFVLQTAFWFTDEQVEKISGKA